MDGTDQFPWAAETSLLAKPAIMDALGAVHLITRPQDETVTAKPDIPFDFDLAKEGIRLLRQDLLKDKLNRGLREAVIATDGRRLSDYRDQLAGNPVAEPTHETPSAGQEWMAEQAAIREAREARATRIAQEESDQAERHQRFQAKVSRLRESSPHLNFENFIELGEGLRLQERDGSLAAAEKKGFQASLGRQVEQHLADPGQLVNDLQVIILAGETAIRPTGQEPVAQDETSLYAKKMFSAISGILLGSHYPAKDFTPDVAAKWLNLGRPLASDMAAGASSEVQQFCWPDNGNFSESGLAALHGRWIILQTLHHIADRQPKKFLSSAYMVAWEGLNPYEGSKMTATIALLRQTFASSLRAGYILHSSAYAANEQTRRQATDLYATLHNFGVPQAALEGKPPAGAAKITGGVDSQTFHAFERYAQTTAGSKTTLAGRIMGSDRERKEKAVAFAASASGFSKFLARLRPKRP